MRTYRLIWHLVTGPLIVVGTLLALGRLGVAEVLALFLPIAFLTSVYAFSFSAVTRAPLRRVLGAGLWTGAAVTGVVGLLGTFGLSSLALLVALVLASPGMVELWARARWVRRVGRFVRDTDDPGPDPGPSQDELTLAWRASCLDMWRATDVATRLQLVELRAQLLEELERRCGSGAGSTWEQTLALVTPVELRSGSTWTPTRPPRQG